MNEILNQIIQIGVVTDDIQRVRRVMKDLFNIDPVESKAGVQKAANAQYYGEPADFSADIVHYDFGTIDAIDNLFHLVADLFVERTADPLLDQYVFKVDLAGVRNGDLVPDLIALVSNFTVRERIKGLFFERERTDRNIYRRRIRSSGSCNDIFDPAFFHIIQIYDMEEVDDGCVSLFDKIEREI